MKLAAILFPILLSCAAPVAPTADTACARACSHLEAIGCPEAKPTRTGATCAQWCGNARDNGLAIDVDCLEHAPSCDAAERCEHR